MEETKNHWEELNYKENYTHSFKFSYKKKKLQVNQIITKLNSLCSTI